MLRVSCTNEIYKLFLIEFTSSLLKAIVSNKRYGYSYAKEALALEDYKAIGGLSFIQLAEIRHRGAFSTVSQTFASCCNRCATSTDSAIADLPRNWYKVNASVFVGDRVLRDDRKLCCVFKNRRQHSRDDPLVSQP